MIASTVIVICLLVLVLPNSCKTENSKLPLVKPRSFSDDDTFGQLWLPKVSSSEKERGFTSGSFEFSVLQELGRTKTKRQITITVEAIIFFQAASYISILRKQDVMSPDY